MRTAPLVVLFAVTAFAAPQQAPVSFTRDIRPLLADRCSPCHGPDAATREAGLRLDLRSSATAPLPSGVTAIVPKHPHASALLARIHHEDPNERMPPVNSGRRPISAAEASLLERWIAEGAPFENHWAFDPPTRPLVPTVNDARHPIDAFVLDRLAREGIAPSRVVEPSILMRRLSTDLIGLPPTFEHVKAFVADPSRAAYEQWIDTLLATPAFGERMAVFWLDLVRYADTVGYHGDQEVSVWPYRDWVIRAFNENMPFDQFTREQLAGDLLPNASLSARVASGYNHLNQKTTEGGAQDKEYLSIYRADRVRTTSTVWMGVTLGCAQCHDHKFDPFTAEDFYRFAAIFEDINNKGFYPDRDWQPTLRVPSADQEATLARLDDAIRDQKLTMSKDTPALTASRAQWIKTKRSELASSVGITLGPFEAAGPFLAKNFDEAYDKDFGPESLPHPRRVADALTWTAHPEWTDGTPWKLTGDNAATYLVRTLELSAATTLELSLGSDDAIKVWVDGKNLLSKKVSRGVAPDQESLTLPLSAGSHTILLKIVNGSGGYGFYFKLKRSNLPDAIARLLLLDPATLTTDDHDALAAYHRTIAVELSDARDQLARLEQEREAHLARIPTTLVSMAIPPREVRVLHRGNWQDESGHVVTPGGPRVFEEIRGSGKRVTRLDLAQWLTSPHHPLTARVFVNRIWALFFGSGLSRSLDDFGHQGDAPSHPELLDWLALEFVESGFDIKRLVRLIVTSDAYRRDATPRLDLRDRDPGNRLLARQGAWRLDAEFVRDHALAVSGLLVERVGGKSAKPYQPKGYFRELNFPMRTYVHDTDEGQHRRGLYTWWQRTFLHPSMKAFDAPSREECTATRPRSNTPLQALALLNDPTYVEAARVLAQRVLEVGVRSDARRLDDALLRVVCREPSPAEYAALMALLASERERFKDQPDAAHALIATGIAPSTLAVSVDEHAAWTQVCRVLLNLHEGITRP